MPGGLIGKSADRRCRKDFTVKANLTLNGRLYVKGDLEVNGSVKMQKGSELIVDGKRTIHGSIREI